MLPVAWAGAMVIVLVLCPPLVPQTLTVIGESWTCDDKPIQISLGIAQLVAPSGPTLPLV
jgi:hypothetical protein